MYGSFIQSFNCLFFNKNFIEHLLSARHHAEHRDAALKKVKLMVCKEARHEMDNFINHQLITIQIDA